MRQLFTTPNCPRCEKIKSILESKKYTDVEIVDCSTVDGLVQRALTETVHVQMAPYLVADGRVVTDMEEILKVLA